MFIFARFEALRASAGITKAAISHALGRTPTLIQDWKQGKSEPSDAQLAIVAEMLHTTSAYLCGETDDPEIPRLDKLSSEERNIINKYRTLDGRGKRLVDLVLDAEAKEVEPDNIVQFPQTKSIPMFGNSFAAGWGDPDFGNAWTDYEVPADSKAEFAIKINGDSMEPYLPDGSIALCQKRAPKDGEVGAFLLDGEYLCKQVCVDYVGDLRLFSLNRNRKDADRLIHKEDAERVTCFGTVMMKKQPLPLD